jgi:hypothetical protein
MRRTVEIVIFVFALILAGLALYAWLASREDQIHLQATLAAQKQLLDAADAREAARAATLQDTLTQIDALKRAVQTPAQVVNALPKYLSLPQPITLSPASAASSPSAPSKAFTDQQGSAPSEKSAAVASPSTANLPDAPSAQIPSADLKPLYDFVQDCRACQAQLAAAKQDATDNATKITAITKERDAAITAAKGGSFWLRLRRNALWFAVGAGAGAVALCATGHCRP